MMNSRWVYVAFVLAIASLEASERPHLQSRLRDGAITVDGRYDDWSGSLQPFEAAPVAVQFLNDGEFLYMRLTASDAAGRRQILRQGFTVWFDPAGGTKKRFGIRYPVVERGSRADDGGRGFGGRRGGEPGPIPDAAPGDRLDILGPGKDDARMLTRDHAQGVDVAIRSEEGVLQYELKVPLTHSAEHPYAIDAGAGKTIGVGLETARPQPSSFGSGGRGGGFGGGMGGRGGGMRPRGGSRGGRDAEGYQAPKPIKGWALLTIAVPAR